MGNTDFNKSLSVSCQVPHSSPQGACRCLPQSGHSAPWGLGGCSARWLLQWRVSCQGQRFSFSLLTSPFHAQPGFRWQKSPAGPAKSLSQQEEVRGGCMLPEKHCFWLELKMRHYKKKTNVAYWSFAFSLELITNVWWSHDAYML